ncbi:hypothetical protein Bca52824_034512 [Brassica carinata]|uniref:Uncharacterized protein n=1 Tax=Brassica carinata TaxID=52824 RepID=A0A8X7S120_BRACI|nr:hypothetical protein Bca52824_034512 [Brassica carinata]
MIDDVLSPVNLVQIGSRLQPNSSGTETVKLARSLIFPGHAGETLAPTSLGRWNRMGSERHKGQDSEPSRGI